jgi:hypothetical protein
MFILFYILIINFFNNKINVFNSKNKIIFFGKGLFNTSSNYGEHPRRSRCGHLPQPA